MAQTGDTDRKSVLITGCSSGIGDCVARGLHAARLPGFRQRAQSRRISAAFERGRHRLPAAGLLPIPRVSEQAVEQLLEKTGGRLFRVVQQRRLRPARRLRGSQPRSDSRAIRNQCVRLDGIDQSRHSAGNARPGPWSHHPEFSSVLGIRRDADARRLQRQQIRDRRFQRYDAAGTRRHRYPRQPDRTRAGRRAVFAPTPTAPSSNTSSMEDSVHRERYLQDDRALRNHRRRACRSRCRRNRC